jgi:D-alanyl-D-alanine dipeptidase
MVELGAMTAQAAVQTAVGSGDRDATLVRLALLEMLRTYASRVEAEGEEAELLQAYRDWLATAIEFFSTGDDALVPEYMRQGEALGVALDAALAPTPAQSAAIEAS